ncbi:MAG: glycosyltransferase family 39 protein [Chloroflexia bacterium]
MVAIATTNQDSVNERRVWQLGLIALVIFTLAKSLVWGAINPPLNTGDESAHLMYVMQVRNYNTLPVFKFAPDCSTGGNSTPAEPNTLAYIQASGYAQLAQFTSYPYESYQPPLYYFTAALVAAPLATNDVDGTIHTGRALSALLVALTTLIFAFAVRELTGKPLLSLIVALLISSIPTFGYYGGVMNNDTMLNLFAASTLLASLRLIRTPSTMLTWGPILLGALTGGSLLSKASGIALIPISLLAILLAVIRVSSTDDKPLKLKALIFSPNTWLKLIVPILLYGASILVIDGWFMARNLVEYGDLLGTADTIKYGAQCWGPTILADGIGNVPRYFMSLALLTPYSFLATFGWGDEGVGLPFYYVAIVPLLLICAYLSIRWFRRHLSELATPQKMGLIVLAASALANIVLWISFNFTIQYQPTGRYLYMAILPIGGFFTVGLLISPNNTRLRTIVIVATLLILHALTIHGWLFAGTGYMATHAAQLGK